MAFNRNLYQEVTDKVIEALEHSKAPWVKPWKSNARFGGLAYNALSGKAYRGINALLLGMHTDQGFMTYNQAKSVGANVRKGEKGSLIVFYKPLQVKDRTKVNPTTGEALDKTIPLLRSFVVFGLSQIDDLPAKYTTVATVTEEPEYIRCALAEELMSKAQVKHGGDRAFYAAGPDYIQLPNIGEFRTVPDYYATALHELTHWTGNDRRLNRTFGKRFGDSNYAREELVAEMGAAFLCAFCGIEGKLQHPEYIKNWLQVLKEDNKAIIQAAGLAQKAADFILADKIKALETETETEELLAA